ncbi:uncharacterized protein LAJ45_08134 [Morchella importuna]|uniref:uncharacterized protein n=1 Tax=Morchella importuna TaxID=1174673 RepID=UPI001E8EBAB1|nr:uncharacterized protein LAJ45_08134 [Morchella importuna]KAH8147670.1 hypothetical protein LAJ45_08134 [Morchella importuna]
MSDDGFDDDFDDGFGFIDDLDYQDDDELSALVDSMAETAFAQGDPIWDEFEADDEEKAPVPADNAGKPPTNGGVNTATLDGAGRTESNGKTNSTGRPLRKRRKLMVVDESGERLPESAPIPQDQQEQAKVTATVIVPLPPTSPRRLNGSESKKSNGVLKEDGKTISSSISVDGLRAAMKRKPSTDEAVISP